MYIQSRACLSATWLDEWIQKFSPLWWAVQAQLIEKSPDNILFLNLFFSWGPMLISKKLYFLKSPDRGVTHFRGSNPFQGDGAKLHFSIETYRTRCFPGGSGLPASLWIRALPMCTCPCLWHFKGSKNETCSKVFKGIGVPGHLKILCRQNHIFLLRSFWEVSRNH